MTTTPLRIHDTTLRKGDESPGASIGPSDRLEIAQALSDAGVGIVEAGFPAASPQIAAAVARVAGEVADAAVAAFARLAPNDVDVAWAAIKRAREPRIVTALAVSNEHLMLRLNSSRDAALAAIERVVRRCASYTGGVTFIAEDATRADRDFVHAALERAAKAGADVVVIADTAGVAQPDEFAALAGYLRERLPAQTTLGVQCSNDLGLALANTLAAIRAGASDIQVTVNGIGPRAGICALEEVSAALLVRADYYGLALAVRTEKLAAISALVADTAAMPVAANKPVVGRNAFRHEAGAHQAAVLKRPSLYEAIPAHAFGRRPAELHFGRQSGRRAIAARLAALGVPLTPAQLEAAYSLFLSVADASRGITDGQLWQIALVVSNATPRVPALTGEFAAGNPSHATSG